MPILYDPSIFDDVVESPVIVTISLLLKLCGLTHIILYIPKFSEGDISTFVTLLVATLIVFTDFPNIFDTFALALYPLVLVSSNTIILLTWYSFPPVKIPTPPTSPGRTEVISDFWLSLFGILRYS